MVCEDLEDPKRILLFDDSTHSLIRELGWVLSDAYQAKALTNTWLYGMLAPAGWV